MSQLRAVVAAVALVLLAAPAAEGALRFKRCGDFGFRCARLTVPLDRSGAVPGEVSLHVKRLPARRRPAQGATFVLAGGPGQSASAVFGGFSLAEIAPAYRRRDLIVFDQRGTGRSGALRCRRLQRANILEAGREAAACAARLGPRRAFYTTPASVEDIEAIRRELGVERITLYGTSYGTKVALAYALAHPANVERLVLDSVVEADGPDTLYLDSFEGVSRVLAATCRAGCRGFTRSPTADVQALVARLAAGPLRGRVYNARGRARIVTLTRGDVFSTLVSGDFDPSLRADFPAAVRSALDGDAAPLLRLHRRSVALESDSPGVGSREFSTAVYAATTCEETRLPWARTAPFERRRADAAVYAESIPPEAFAPFDRATALDNDILNLCEFWPSAPTAPAYGAGPLPDVPVLLLAGEDDLRTPVESARRVAAQFPQARLYVASSTGHSALGSDFSGCIERAFDRFFLGRSLPRPCRRRRRLARPTRPLPVTLRQVRPVRGLGGRRGRTLQAALLTLDDVLQDYSFGFLGGFFNSSVSRGAGLRGGRWVERRAGGIKLRRVRLVRGVTVSGVVSSPLQGSESARLRIGGPAAADGRLVLRRRRISGRLGGRRIGARASIAAPAVAAQAAARPPRLR